MNRDNRLRSHISVYNFAAQSISLLAYSIPLSFPYNLKEFHITIMSCFVPEDQSSELNPSIYGNAHYYSAFLRDLTNKVRIRD